MIGIEIPGRELLQIHHLVTDVNGTLALDGLLLRGVAEALLRLQTDVKIHMLTANTHGRQGEIDRALGLTSIIIPQGEEAEAKARLVRDLGAEHVAAIGQGANDAGMLQEASLGICVLSREGTALSALQAADVLFPDVLSALELFQYPRRLAATLRT
ncbi:MAG: hypothetical protein JXA97_12815 [Anaerolineales bacterium]|nr:hypothetical protein [Anaerolineales bacterium]